MGATPHYTLYTGEDDVSAANKVLVTLPVLPGRYFQVVNAQSRFLVERPVSGESTLVTHLLIAQDNVEVAVVKMDTLKTIAKSTDAAEAIHTHIFQAGYSGAEVLTDQGAATAPGNTSIRGIGGGLWVLPMPGEPSVVVELSATASASGYAGKQKLLIAEWY